MANLMDYLDWRGDLTLEISPFNEDRKSVGRERV